MSVMKLVSYCDDWIFWRVQITLCCRLTCDPSNSLRVAVEESSALCSACGVSLGTNDA